MDEPGYCALSVSRFEIMEQNMLLLAKNNEYSDEDITILKEYTAEHSDNLRLHRFNKIIEYFQCLFHVKPEQSNKCIIRYRISHKPLDIKRKNAIYELIERKNICNFDNK